MVIAPVAAISGHSRHRDQTAGFDSTGIDARDYDVFARLIFGRIDRVLIV
jgi:hypothetical protein